jgi:O-acetyl-ADP-ribose deacetylase (regulator of RNase III)
MTGGVGAQIVMRYGVAMQDALRAQIVNRNPRCAQRGEIFPYSGLEMPYRVVLNAVAIDGWYHSSPEAITEIVGRALNMAMEAGGRKVALTALATGYGPLTMPQFAQGIEPLMNGPFHAIDEVVICLLLDFEVAELARHLPGAVVVTEATRTEI